MAGTDQRHPPSGVRIRLLGRVADVPACELVADGAQLAVGSAPACDLCVSDPLLPPCAFRLQRRSMEGTVRWLLDVPPNVRLYLNDDLTRRDLLRFGDVITVGCHRFVFEPAPEDARNLRSTTNVEDVYSRLLRPAEVPAAFLAASPARQSRQRMRQAVLGGLLLVLALGLLVWRMPRATYFEQVQPALEVEMAAERAMSPAPDRVRALGEVERRSVTAPDTPPLPPELAARSAPAPTLTTPEARVLGEAPAPARPVELHAPAVDPGRLTPVDPAAKAEVRLAIERAARTPQAAPARRLSLQELQDPDLREALADHQVKLDPEAAEATPLRDLPIESAVPPMPAGPEALRTASLAAPLPPVRVTERSASRVSPTRTTAALASSATARRLASTEAAAAPRDPGEVVNRGPVTLDPDRAGRARTTPLAGTGATAGLAPVSNAVAGRPVDVARLLQYQPSPLTYETHGAGRIPVARLPGALASLELKGTDTALTLDGDVSEGEIALCWKSGQFRIHGPNPQPAEPRTFCYVGRIKGSGKECLYVSFVCEDPDVSRLVDGQADLWKDDSVELFLDTNADRGDYYHMIINTRGRFTARYCRNGDEGINYRGSPWNVTPTIRTAVHPQSRRWTCEIQIPFESLGGVPSPGSRWAVNFTRAFRGQNAGGIYQNWFLVYNGRETNYHNPGLYGIFQW